MAGFSGLTRKSLVALECLAGVGGFELRCAETFLPLEVSTEVAPKLAQPPVRMLASACTVGAALAPIRSDLDSLRTTVPTGEAVMLRHLHEWYGFGQTHRVEVSGRTVVALWWHS